MKFLVKSDQWSFRLYREGGELPETLKEHRVEGHRCIGYYTTMLDLLEGARNHLLKDKSKRGAELRVFLEAAIVYENKTLKDLTVLAESTAKLERPS